ncbi:ribosomal protein [Thermosipho sp. 1063]|uniref:ribosomal-processing cysteine protease Prp n=1 Tax=unclassified Thermosipho (in: thermotogales) TaxID=2676525 RepID=UPI00094928BF|nr:MULTISPECIES: ribosomal-processing cysteine protease Prp [unclassified Thermosipho (in: thermotogales)]ANQ53952.1 ribosomal protein [Thermosipho sp. 1070]APT72397.1 ribosomal protein [Thermosipho sp. 1063]OOC43639.1 ribosomal protein [Thermosipho sp. 1074]
MIKCIFTKKNGVFENFLITGHAMYEEKGKDIICAAVSTVSQHTARFLEKQGAKATIKDGYLMVEKIPNDEISQIFVKELTETLLDLSLQFSKFIKMEVTNDED